MKKKTFSTIVYVILPIVMVLTAVIVVLTINHTKQQDLALQEEAIITPAQLADNQVGSGGTAGNLTEEVKDGSLLTQLGAQVPDKEIDWDELHKENKDIYAWLSVPGTDVEYPILQHPTENDYYLEYNIDGSYGRPGCIYTQLYNSKDFTDPMTVIYGHNMHDGTMFATLHNFEDAAFFNNNKFFYIYTPEKTFVYEVYAAYQYSNAHLLLTVDTKTPESFWYYLIETLNRDCSMVEHVRSEEELGITLDSNCRVVTLSTCIKGQEDRRWLVQGVLVGDVTE